jgi:hypothetical protein
MRSGSDHDAPSPSIRSTSSVSKRNSQTSRSSRMWLASLVSVKTSCRLSIAERYTIWLMVRPRRLAARAISGWVRTREKLNASWPQPDHCGKVRVYRVCDRRLWLAHLADVFNAQPHRPATNSMARFVTSWSSLSFHQSGKRAVERRPMQLSPTKETGIMQRRDGSVLARPKSRL